MKGGGKGRANKKKKLCFELESKNWPLSSRAGGKGKKELFFSASLSEYEERK